MKKTLFVLLAAVAASFPALAIDGQILINQSTVMAAGGFPYTISQPGSYKLTGNLSAPSGSGAIVITAANVTLDLNGFSITTPAQPLGTSIIGVMFGQKSAPVTVKNGNIGGYERPLGYNLDRAGVIETALPALTALEDLTLYPGGIFWLSNGTRIFRVTAFQFSVNPGDPLDPSAPGGPITIPGCPALVESSVLSFFSSPGCLTVVNTAN